MPLGGGGQQEAAHIVGRSAARTASVMWLRSAAELCPAAEASALTRTGRGPPSLSPGSREGPGHRGRRQASLCQQPSSHAGGLRAAPPAAGTFPDLTGLSRAQGCRRSPQPRGLLGGLQTSPLCPQLGKPSRSSSVSCHPRHHRSLKGPIPVSLSQQSCWGEERVSCVRQGTAGHSCVLRTRPQSRLEHEVERHCQHGPRSRRPDRGTACPGAGLAPVPASQTGPRPRRPRWEDSSSPKQRNVEAPLEASQTWRPLWGGAVCGPPPQERVRQQRVARRERLCRFWNATLWPPPTRSEAW